MSATANQLVPEEVGHMVLHGVSWATYEAVLAEIGNRQLRVAFDNGELEIMSPLPEHEINGKWVARLIELLGLERGMEIIGLKSTTFRDSVAAKGLEPDECYYVQNAGRVGEITGAFDPLLHCPPDLAIEVEVSRKAIAREPIYAALKVPEVWYVSSRRILCRILQSNGACANAMRSAAFPFLEPAALHAWVMQLARASQTVPILRRFQVWARKLA